MADADLCAESLEALEMEVDGTRADGTAARQGNLGLSAASEQRLGLAPTPLETGMKATVAWWQEQDGSAG